MTLHSENISIVGGGKWGTALANILSQSSNSINLLSRNLDTVYNIQNFSCNKNIYPNHILPKNIVASSNFEILSNSSIIVVAIATRYLQEFFELNIQHISNTAKIIICCKGVDPQNFRFPVSIAKDFIDLSQIFILSGPNFADEIIMNLPSCTTIAGHDLNDALYLANILKNSRFRIYSSNAVESIQLCGILKNIYAIGSGVISQMQLGQNTQSAFIGRSLVEIKRFVNFYTQSNDDIDSIAGVSDLILTCSSTMSRNFSFGQEVILNIDNISKFLEKNTVEGYHSIRMIYDIARSNDIHMPILYVLYRVIFENSNINDEIRKLMER